MNYSIIGAKIERGRGASLREKLALRKQGINRGNATFDIPDKMTIYGFTNQGIIGINFYAAGGHNLAKCVDEQEDTIAYFLDSMLCERAEKLLQKQKIMFFPFKSRDGVRPGELYDPYDGSINKSLFTRDFDELSIYKMDEVGITIESLLNAQQQLEEKCQKGIPAIGIRTTPSDSENYFASCDINEAIDILNRLVKKYRKYINGNGYPYDKSQHQRMRHIFNTKKLDLTSIANWYTVDSAPTVLQNVKEAMHALAVSALQQRNIDTTGFRLIRFSKPYEEDNFSIHYKKLDI